MRRIDIIESLEDLLRLDKLAEDAWQDNTINGECSGCGGCCGRLLPISDQEIRTIKRYIKKHHIEEQTHFIPTAVPMTDATCPFRSDREKKCLIYEVRPAICRDYRCDKPKKQIKADRELYHGKYTVCDMRAEFYGREPLI